ncbi:KH domain-containing protein [Candidatus Cytomitobacter primus]|uniref:K Homology domain-containing protein n=1 Tax=Candidatus Cytomitobacter primus TaxID=2066024 RepID=A0A5C0UG39_9PROT|nr:KH domain-containing protein [Candidatus Cytomitobacter primus]QEK38690.1 hypothetical protein FZC34_02100 [Candidatus Cytomitobacter primus]
MSKKNLKKCIIGGAEISLRDDIITANCDASVLIKHGNTSILCTVCIGDWENKSYLPLQVIYQERAYAAGKIPGGFLKREGKKDKEALISRMIDRALRPSINQSYKYNVQVICTVLDYDNQYYNDMLSIIGSSIALQMAGVPCVPMCAYKMSFNGEKWNFGTTKDRKHTITFARTSQGLVMVDSYGDPIKRIAVSEGINSSIEETNSILELANSFVYDRRNEIKASPVVDSQNISVDTQLILERLQKNNDISDLKNDFLSQWSNKDEGHNKWNQIVRAVARNAIVWSGNRFDGRSLSDLRSMKFDSGILNSANGSGLYSKEKTQVLSSVTFGNPEDSQIVETLDGTYKDKFIFHYIFDPYSCGDIRKIAVARRDIGHGNLAKRSIKPLLDNKRMLRVVADVMSSDGSSSMASVCASYLAMRDADMKIEPVAGISVGLILEGYRHYLLMDINAQEDAWGDMDFKISGTQNGITSIQMDIKVPWIPMNVFDEAMQFGMQGVKNIINMYPAKFISKSDEDVKKQSKFNDNVEKQAKPDHARKRNAPTSVMSDENATNDENAKKYTKAEYSDENVKRQHNKIDKQSNKVEGQNNKAENQSNKIESKPQSDRKSRNKTQNDQDIKVKKSKSSPNAEHDMIKEKDSGAQYGNEGQVKLSIEPDMIPSLIGRKGAVINDIESLNVRIDIDKKDNTILIQGEKSNINQALIRVFEIMKGKNKVAFVKIIHIHKDKLRILTFDGKEKNVSWDNKSDIQVGDFIKATIGKFGHLNYLDNISIK